MPWTRASNSSSLPKVCQLYLWINQWTPASNSSSLSKLCQLHLWINQSPFTKDVNRCDLVFIYFILFIYLFIKPLVQRLISRWTLSASQWQLYSAILCICSLVECDSKRVTVALRVLNIQLSGYSAVWLLHSWCRVKLLRSRRKFYEHHAPLYSVTLFETTYIGCMWVVL